MINRIIWMLEGRSGSWPKFRKAFLKKNFCCEACCTDKKLEVHHIVPFKVNKALELEENNCITLCKSCHLVLAHFKDYQLYNPLIVKTAREFLFERVKAVGRKNSSD
jgi:5-methylcytosine-specific restriction endonuclease McrA